MKKYLNLRKVATIVACLAVTTTFVQAQTPVTINVGTLGATGAENSGNPTEAQWYYNAINKTLYLWSDNGNYTLTGTNANLRLRVDNYSNINVTLNGANIAYSIISGSGSVYIGQAVNNFTITLIGNNFLEGATENGIFIMSSGSFTITSSSGGSLTAKGQNESILLTPAANFVISGNAAVTAESTSRSAIAASGNIKMDDAAKLTMKPSTAESHNFEKLNPASTYEWKLTNATTTDPLTNAVISVSVAAGQTVTVERVIGTSGIDDIAVENATVTGYFDILGRKLPEEPTKGLYIIQYDNGKTVKIIKN